MQPGPLPGLYMGVHDYGPCSASRLPFRSSERVHSTFISEFQILKLELPLKPQAAPQRWEISLLVRQEFNKSNEH
jgi:hypothetical protein